MVIGPHTKSANAAASVQTDIPVDVAETHK